MNARTEFADDDVLHEHLATNRYYDRVLKSSAVKILPGEYFVTRQEMVLVTVLGSCISACIRDREKGIGGMNHFMLPEGGEDKGGSARYGGFAMEVLVNHLLKMGARRSQLEAKIFGGGAVMSSLTSSQVGERNASFAIEYLRTEGIPIAASDLLDVYPRKLYYFPVSGRVLMKKLIHVQNDTLAKRESEYARRLKQKPISGDVELFV
ncbi:MAG TPA: chemoreceptor glutamine deamidase CheD [Rhodocyclaceae bacterium]|nr:chemoreceptor glutamine deamidase CheD [Rhodocyclaceae bacterium]HMV52112.1 chemoreceptor glutamine deamidase CheD [Rhodocyclaceae bacterium]HMZ82939.1 chemoreceptor glutamine deamidase CheD [Rhodocyclaceae bacterium]HNA03093.1 chemoreceptor glutamine deamidase CheD [Rhodocyclaceae bacterium]HNB76911.1 chemoreceptor glutamine deamidase CheD [Rhodocyclaceae bacterium]